MFRENGKGAWNGGGDVVGEMGGGQLLAHSLEALAHFSHHLSIVSGTFLILIGLSTWGQAGRFDIIMVYFYDVYEL